MVYVFDSVCKRQNLKLKVNRSKVMIFERSIRKFVYSNCAYRPIAECTKIMLNEFELNRNGRGT